MTEINRPPGIETADPQYCARIIAKFRRPKNLRLIKYDDISSTVRYHNKYFVPKNDIAVADFLTEMRTYVVNYARSGNEFGAIHAAVGALLMLSFKDDFFNDYQEVNGWTQYALAQTLRIPFSNPWDIYYEFENTFQRTIDTYYT